MALWICLRAVLKLPKALATRFSFPQNMLTFLVGVLIAVVLLPIAFVLDFVLALLWAILLVPVKILWAILSAPVKLVEAILRKLLRTVARPRGAEDNTSTGTGDVADRLRTTLQTFSQDTSK